MGVVPGPVTVKFAVVMVAGFIGSLNLMLIAVSMGTFDAAFAGVVELTTGTLISVLAPLV
jgi:hypothetical protein